MIIHSHSPGVVAFAEDHPSLCETRPSNVRQRGLATRALEAGVVPVAVERMQQEPVHDLGPAPGTAPGASTTPAGTTARWREVLLLLLQLLLRVLLLLLLHAHARAMLHHAHHVVLLPGWATVVATRVVLG